MSVTKAALGIADWLDVANSSINSKDQYYTVVIPVLVLDAPLYSCYLDENSEVSIDSIDRCTMQWRNSIGGMPNTIIEIITKTSLSDFLQEMGTALLAIQGLALKPNGQISA